MKGLTDPQRESLLRAIRTAGWVRSTSAGERVTLASLERRGFLERRPWRGDGISRDSAFEYRPSLAVRRALEQRRRAGGAVAIEVGQNGRPADCDEDSPSPYGDDDYAPELEVTFARRRQLDPSWSPAAGYGHAANLIGGSR